MMISRGLMALLAMTLVAADDGVYVAVGYGGRRACSKDGATWEHDQRWSDVAADDDNVLFNVAYGRGTFVAVGGASVGHILTTRDGEKWTEVAKPKGRVATVAFGDGRFVAGHGDEFLVSGDGEHWKPGAKLEINGGLHPRKSAFGNGVFVVIGDYDVEYKTRVGFRASTADGLKVASFEEKTPAARSIAFANGRFVVVGPEGLVQTSEDGKTWDRTVRFKGQDFQAVAWTGKWFVVSGGNALVTSPDGLSWRIERNPLPCNPLNGRVGATWGGNLWKSADGLDWSKVALQPGPSFEAVAFGKPGKD